MDKKRVLLSPLDPVHDIGLKMINKALKEAGYETYILPPDFTPGEIVEEAFKREVDVVLLSRTLGYKVEEVLGQFVDLAEATGLRKKAKLGIGGMAITPELAAELGFDGGFGPQTGVEEALAFVEGRTYVPKVEDEIKSKGNLVAHRTYRYHNQAIEALLDQIADQVLSWAEGVVTPGIERALLRRQFMRQDGPEEKESFFEEYSQLCDPVIRDYFAKRVLPAGIRVLDAAEVGRLNRFLEQPGRKKMRVLQHRPHQPLVFVQYGTGCPVMDIAHIKVAEAWGADGVVHFDPSWNAKSEGFLFGPLTHLENGSIITWDNLILTKRSLEQSTLWQVRAHRGLNTPETVVLAGEAGADLTKINPVYGSLGGGTDPERLVADAVACLKYAASYNLPFDIPTNEELCGVPAYKALAGILIVAHLGIRLKAQPILQPLFCFSPEMMIGGRMDDNYMDFNAAKIKALRAIVDAPIWPGAPIGFLTHTEERVQSAVTTGLHAGLAASLGVEAISIASTDEAYSRGPITVSSRVDTLQSVAEVFRFAGSGSFSPTARAEEWAGELERQIYDVLKQVVERGSLTQSLYDGILGSRAEGAHPGRNGRDTVRARQR